MTERAAKVAIAVLALLLVAALGLAFVLNLLRGAAVEEAREKDKVAADAVEAFHLADSTATYWADSVDLLDSAYAKLQVELDAERAAATADEEEAIEETAVAGREVDELVELVADSTLRVWLGEAIERERDGWTRQLEARGRLLAVATRERDGALDRVRIRDVAIDSLSSAVETARRALAEMTESRDSWRSIALDDDFLGFLADLPKAVRYVVDGATTVGLYVAGEKIEALDSSGEALAAGYVLGRIGS